MRGLKLGLFCWFGFVAPTSFANAMFSMKSKQLWAIDAGLKYKGLAFNVEFYLRWLNNFTVDMPVPITSMFDWGFDASLGYFLGKSVEVYVRSSLIDGPFATAVRTSATRPSSTERCSSRRAPICR